MDQYERRVLEKLFGKSYIVCHSALNSSNMNSAITSKVHKIVKSRWEDNNEIGEIPGIPLHNHSMNLRELNRVNGLHRKYLKNVHEPLERAPCVYALRNRASSRRRRI